MNTSIEERKAMGELALQSLFKHTMNLIPVAGPVLSDVLFEFRNKVKQDRLFKFLDLLKEHFSNENPEVNIDNAKSEEFSDLFENVLNKVAQSRSEQKIIGFKNLLIHGFKNKGEINDCELFTDLLIALNENDILILHMHKDFLYDDGGLVDKKHELTRELEEYKRNQNFFGKPIIKTAVSGKIEPSILLTMFRDEKNIKDDIDRVDRKIAQYKKQMTAESFSITKGEFIYAIQNLYNKGLLIDQGVGSIGIKPFELMAITDFGARFLKFITIS
jgi:hypothetical protein